MPEVNRAAWPKNDVDRFGVARLEREGLASADEADRSTFIRRVSLDLTGLPPARAEAFLADPAPDASEKLVDRLFASPYYGERMAASEVDPGFRAPW